MLRRCALIAALLLVVGPASARADWLFTPNIGLAFGGDAHDKNLTYGATIGWMGAGIIGFEGDFSYSTDFFEGSQGGVDFLDSDNVTSLMGNIVLGIPVGGQTGGGIRPYASGGVGWLRTKVSSEDDIFNASNDDFGFNLGAGLYIFATDHVGFRGDLRYYRSFQDPEPDNEFDIGLGTLDFWRGTAGVTFRW